MHGGGALTPIAPIAGLQFELPVQTIVSLNCLYQLAAQLRVPFNSPGSLPELPPVIANYNNWNWNRWELPGLKGAGMDCVATHSTAGNKPSGPIDDCNQLRVPVPNLRVPFLKTGSH
jgi:hypothetical protein